MPTMGDRGEDLSRYAGLVQTIVGGMVQRLPQRVEKSELLQEGWMGLLKASRRRRVDMSEEDFRSFAARRISGAVIDYLRQQDTLTRPQRRRVTSANKAGELLRQRLQREPTQEEICAYLEVSLAQLEATRSFGEGSTLQGFDEETYDPQAPQESPEALAIVKQLCDAYGDARALRSKLDPRLQWILRRYYEDDAPLREIAEQLNVTESRVCQLHRDAVRALQKLIKERTFRTTCARRGGQR